MALVVLPIGHAVTGKDILATPLTRERLYAVVPATHALATRTTVGLKELSAERFVFLKDGRCYSENIASAFRRAKLHPNVVSESASPLHVVAMVCSGIGISVVPEHAVDLRRAECRFIPVSGDDGYSEIGLVVLKGRSSSRARRSFSKFLKEYPERETRKGLVPLGNPSPAGYGGVSERSSAAAKLPADKTQIQDASRLMAKGP